VLEVRDVVAAYVGAWDRIGRVRGNAYNLGGGPANAISLRQLVSHIEAITGHPAQLRYAAARSGDQRYYVSDSRRIGAALDLPPPLPWRDGVHRLADWLRRRSDEPIAQTTEAALP
jgi:CDP-paratose 2-epimerase